MGRIAQAVDYFNASPKDAASAEYRAINYTNILITPEAKEARRYYNLELKKTIKQLNLEL